MAFWTLEQASKDPAAIDATNGRVWTYADLQRDTDQLAAALPDAQRKLLGLILTENRYECLVAWLAALRAGSAVILLERGTNASLIDHIVGTYHPDWIFTADSNLPVPGYRANPNGGLGLFEAEGLKPVAIHPELALLLSTSGSTGSPKMVRLSYRNIDSNARAIAQYLGLNSQERPITSLPMGYSYGLSVINSHLHVGAAIVFSRHPVMRKEFWEIVDQYRCSSFAGVPYTYQTLLSMGLLRSKGLSVKTWTQAGGRLDDRHIEEIQGMAAATGRKFFVMYGQTEAAPRISYVPFESLKAKVGSIGIAIPGGALRTDNNTGELLYSGPNVMLGYATCRDNLSEGDELHGTLHTGDLARQDADGFFYIIGRLKRFLKLFGKRLNLDEAETILTSRTGAPVACHGRDDLLIAVTDQPCDLARLRKTACEIFDLPQAAVAVRAVQQLPTNGNGKIDYNRLAIEFDALKLAPPHP